MRFFILLSILASIATAEEISLSARAQSILNEKCSACHAGSRTMGGLSLDSAAAIRAAGKSGTPAVVPGNPEGSELLRRIKATDVRTRMPFGQKALAAEETALLENWIRDGAKWSDAPLAGSSARTPWAYRPLLKTAPPPVHNTAWVRNGIDAFILSALEAKGIAPAEEASRAVLVRRLSMDLTGLPPGAPVRGSLHDFAEHLLNSPRFGERWGRHWLDLARYADSEGYENDKDVPFQYRYRDFVIRALNADMPFDQFVRWQLAGDEFAPDNEDALVATGFLTSGPRVQTAASDSAENKERFLYDQLDDMISTVSVSLLATTAGCARCHDHKYDPIPTRDYYSLAAVFRNIDREEKPLSQAHWVRDRWLTQRRAAFREEKMEVLKIPESDRELLRWPLNPNHSGQAAAYREWNGRLQYSDGQFSAWLGPEGRKHRDELDLAVARLESESEAAPPKGTFFLDSGAAPRPSWLLARGDVSKKAEPVTFGFLSALTRDADPETYRKRLVSPGHDTTYRRAALAEWLVDSEHGAGALLARVVVNRIWQHHFGQGLVRTADDFGLQGEKPSNPALLDWLAGELIRSGWHLRSVHRLILNSATWAQSSAFDAGKAKIDPDARLFWRHVPQRVEAESLRDSILAVSGSLDLRMYGPPVRPWIPPDAIATRTVDPWPKSLVDGPDSWRRSVYLMVKRSVRVPMMETFDVPDPNTSCGRRLDTTLPTQSLTLLNDTFVRNQAERFARRVAREAGASVGAKVQLAWSLALSREPSPDESASAVRFLAEAQHPEEALTDLCHALFNLNEFSYVD